MTTYEAVRACCLATLAGHVLHAEGLSASACAVIDWRTIRCGETLQEGGDAFDNARLFAGIVGAERAHEAAVRALGREPAPPSPEPVSTPEIHAYMADPATGGRRRAFDCAGFWIIVEPHEDDAAQADFTARLAAAAALLGRAP